MNDVHYRMQLNPALTPGKGYIDIPVLGNFNLAASSNSLGSQDILDAFNGDRGDLTGDVLYDRLKDFNRMNLAFNTDIISVGWWKGKNFWSVSTGLRMDFGANVPKSMFTLLRDVDNNDKYDDWANYKINIEDESLNFNAYTELGLGYARDLNERLTIGGKFKLLLGIGNLNMNINRIAVETSGITGGISEWESWQNSGRAKLQVDATLESSLSGMELLKNSDGYINDFDYGKSGVAGYGGAVDFGLAFRALDNLTLSAAVNDLGFISWSKSSSNIFSAETTREYTKDNYQEFVDIVKGDELLNYELFGFKHEEQTKSRTTTLYSSVTAGAEYALMNNKLALGALFTTRMLKPETQSEITIGASLRPKSWFNLAASYSVIQSAGKSFGLAVKLGPLFAGTDYMYFGKNSEVINAFVGITIPLGKKASAATF
ncbi:hypothetical protein AGMMS50239_07640 [Bacteroidia bacterium]|nr:hypothetical protein AGMMS50239_07640 [Bacteroidia bacterium]